MIGDPGAVAFTHNGRNRMYAFVRGNRGGLQDCFWNAAPNITSWQWDNRGTIPGGVALTTSPSPVASRSDASAPEASLHIFAGGDDNAMHECYWDGVAWLGQSRLPCQHPDSKQTERGEHPRLGRRG